MKTLQPYRRFHSLRKFKKFLKEHLSKEQLWEEIRRRKDYNRMLNSCKYNIETYYHMLRCYYIS